MKITLLTIGSRGDVQPFIALGLGLKAAGHTVTVATHSPYESFVRGFGLGFAPLAGDPRAMLEGEGGLAWLETGRNPLAMLNRMRDLAQPLVRQIAADSFAACADAEALIFSTLGFFPAIGMLDALKIPAMGAYLQPLHPSAEFPAIVFPDLGPAPYNRLTHAAQMELTWLLFRGMLNGMRAEVAGLPPITQSFRHTIHTPFPVVYGYSPRVLPKPADWGPDKQVVGYWFLDTQAGWTPPADLLDFLADGPPPVYIGFGSMANRDPARMTEVALEALRRSGQRGLLLTGWGGITGADLPDTVYRIESAPHEWLFPQMAAVVHHGGAGTTAAGLRAGVPSILIPHFADQPFWGRRVAALGVGPRAIGRRALTAEALAGAIRRAVGDAGMRARAADLGRAIRTEDGVGAAVRAFEAVIGERGKVLSSEQ